MGKTVSLIFRSTYLKKLTSVKLVDIIRQKGGNIMEIRCYDYRELRDAYIRDRSEENLIKLGKWLSLYGDNFWNGEYWDVDGFRISYDGIQYKDIN